PRRPTRPAACTARSAWVRSRPAGPGRFVDMDHPTSNPSSALVPLAVWLEPGYEGGRVGAWARDLPGAFAAAPTPERALSAILTTTARVREWLEAHGDDAGLGTLGRVEIEG